MPPFPPELAPVMPLVEVSFSRALSTRVAPLFLQEPASACMMFSAMHRPIPVAYARPQTPQQYVQARLGKFGFALCRRLAPALTPQQIDYLCREVAASLQQQQQQQHQQQQQVAPVPAPPPPVPMLPQHNLRLVLRHDCQ